MAEKNVVKEVADVVVTANELMKGVTKFVEENIVKVDVRVTEGPVLKEGRKLVAEGLRNLAKLVEDPTQKITWVDIKKTPEKKPKK